MAKTKTGKQSSKADADYVGVLVTLMVVASWFLALAIVWTLSEAAPETAWGMDHLFGVSRSGKWRGELVSLAESMTLGLMMLTFLGIGIQTTQSSAERGSFNKSLVGLAGASIAGLVAFFLVA